MPTSKYLTALSTHAHINVFISTFYSYAHIKVFISTFYSYATSKYLSKGYTHITHHNNYTSGRRDHMVVGFTTTYAISEADHH